MQHKLILLAISVAIGLATVGRDAVSHASHGSPMLTAQTPMQNDGFRPVLSWYNCGTRERWSLAKLQWCQRMDTLRQGAYQLPNIGSVQLDDGRYEAHDRSMWVTLVDRPGTVMFDDVNDDGVDDAIALLTANMGGSEILSYLSVMWGNGSSNPSSTLLGDRVDIQAIAVESGQINVDMVTQGPDDPLCCPTMRVLHRYAVQGDQLTLVFQEEAPLNADAQLPDQLAPDQ